jgi:hypothetical protein
MAMNRNALGVAALTALVALSPACGTSSTPATPVAPSTPSAGLNDAAGGAGGSSLKASTPVVQSPLNNVTTASLTPTLVVTGGGLTFASGAVQYRFRIMDAGGTVAADSGLVSGGSWTPSAPLTPTSKYTWIARSEYQGLNGLWSAASTFTTPVAPGNDYGAWETTCQGRDGEALVICVWNFVRPTNSVQDLEVVKRVAWLLRGQRAGLLLKGSGENTVPWLGMTFSATRVCFPDGHIYKIIGDAGPGGGNTPGWGDNDFVETSLYVAAIDPRLR